MVAGCWGQTLCSCQLGSLSASPQASECCDSGLMGIMQVFAMGCHESS